jgi:ribosome modulation factor
MKKKKNPEIPITIIETQEIDNNDKQKLGYWKQALNGTNRGECPNNVRDILDKNLPGWRDKHDLCNKALELAKNIINRANERKKNGRNFIPKNYYKKEDKLNLILKQETSDYGKMSRWRDALYGKKIGQCICPDEVRDILDEHLNGWRTVEEETPKPKKSMKLKEPSAKKETPKPKKSYEEMTENERRDFIEKHLKNHKEKKGYNSTNPDDKDRLNNVFSKNISIQSEGKIIFLDHIEFKTAYALLEYGIKPEDMIIPQRVENYSEMHQHEIFGQSVVLEEFNDTLNRLENENIKIKAVYADYCSTLEKDGIPFLELMSRIKEKKLLCQNAILGVTITLRNPEGVRFQGQDITIMEKKILRTFPNNENLLLKSNLTTDDEAYTYGNGAPMATWLFNINN